jgi:SRSO17 transposase
MKILEIPKEFKEMLLPFRQFMTGPQFKHFTRYVFGLIVAEKKKKTVEGINALYAEKKDRSNLTRFMIESPLEMEPILNKALEKHWKHLNIPVGFNLYLVIDDSDTEKSGKKMEGAGYFKCHNGEKQYVFGHNFVLMLASCGLVAVPVGIRLYLKEEYCKGNKIPFKSKNQLAAELIENFRPPKAVRVSVLFDSWYLNQTVVKICQEKGYPYISQAKSNRTIYVEGEKFSATQYAKRQRGRALKQTTYVPRSQDSPVKAKSLLVKLNRLGKVRLVISRNEEGKYVFLVTDHLRLPMVEVIRRYDIRWDIECYFRDAKQHLGLGDYQMRSLQGIVRHLYAVMIACILLAQLKLSLAEAQACETIGELCLYVRQLLYRNLLRTIFKYSRTKKDRAWLAEQILAN